MDIFVLCIMSPWVSQYSIKDMTKLWQKCILRQPFEANQEISYWCGRGAGDIFHVWLVTVGCLFYNHLVSFYSILLLQFELRTLAGCSKKAKRHIAMVISHLLSPEMVLLNTTANHKRLDKFVTRFTHVSRHPTV